MMADEVDGGQRADTADGGPRWVGPAIFIGAPVVAAIVVVAWFFGWGFFGADHPFGDERACAGSDVPLQPALEDAGIALPADATGVHYPTRSAPQDGQFIIFRVELDDAGWIRAHNAAVVVAVQNWAP